MNTDDFGRRRDVGQPLFGVRVLCRSPEAWLRSARNLEAASSGVLLRSVSPLLPRFRRRLR